MCLRFDTCYLGHYFDIYYIFVKLLKKEKVVPKIVAHTLPSFLPIDEWEKESLATDVQVMFFLLAFHLQSFTQCVSLHLNSFIARREQCKAVQAAYPSAELTASMGYTHVSIAFDHFRLQLVYPAASRRPCSVEQTVNESESSFPGAASEPIRLLSQHKADFQHRELVDVLSDLIVSCVFYTNKQTQRLTQARHTLFLVQSLDPSIPL